MKYELTNMHVDCLLGNINSLKNMCYRNDDKVEFNRLLEELEEIEYILKNKGE